VLANNNEIVALTARAAVDYIRRGEISAERYAQALLEHHKAHTNLNVVAHMDEARLLEDARAIDRSRAQGARLGALAGLPMILKDNINTVGFPTTAGTSFLKVLPQGQCTSGRFAVQAGGHPVCKIQHARARLGKHERQSDVRLREEPL
jgi:Asp-tRNA(Asn)/Glu-tRNA(Gln) amidotransferase A subunit family amidase